MPSLVLPYCITLSRSMATSNAPQRLAAQSCNHAPGLSRARARRPRTHKRCRGIPAYRTSTSHTRAMSYVVSCTLSPALILIGGSYRGPIEPFGGLRSDCDPASGSRGECAVLDGMPRRKTLRTHIGGVRNVRWVLPRSRRLFVGTLVSGVRATAVLVCYSTHLQSFKIHNRS